MKRVKVFGFGVAATMVLVAPAALAGEVGVVWDAPVNPDLSAFVDQQFGDFADFSTYLVHHVRLEQTTAIHQITSYYTNQSNLWPVGATGGTYSIFAQVDGLPGPNDDPAANQIEGNLAAGPNGFEFTIDLGGSVVLQPGNYWFGLTVAHDFGVFGQEFHQGSDVSLKNSAARNPGGGFGLGFEWFDAGQSFNFEDWSGAITITGVPTPGALALLGIAGLAGTRRRRR